MISSDNGTNFLLDLSKKAIEYKKSGNFIEAIECYEKILNATKSSNEDPMFSNFLSSIPSPEYFFSSIYHGLGACYYLLGRFNESKSLGSVECYEKAESYYSKASLQDADIYVNRATNLCLLGRESEAMNFCDEAIRLNPNFANAYVMKGVLLRNKGDDSEAIEFYEKAIKASPSLPQPYHNIAKVLFKEGKLEESLEYYQKALNLYLLSPIDEPLKNEYIYCIYDDLLENLFVLEKYNDVISHIEFFASSTKDELKRSEIYCNSAFKFYDIEGYKETAVDWFRKSEFFNPNIKDLYDFWPDY